MSFEKLELQKEAISQGAVTGNADLAGLPGTGTLQVWRGQREEVLRMVGTWRLEEDSSGLEKIREALSSSTPVLYDGVLDDPAQPDRSRLRATVYITSVGSYHRGGDGVDYCFVNFVPAEQTDVAG